MSELYNGARSFLQSIDMIRYWDVFKAKGYDREDDIPDITEQDMDCMNIVGEDRRLILQAGT